VIGRNKLFISGVLNMNYLKVKNLCMEKERIRDGNNCFAGLPSVLLTPPPKKKKHTQNIYKNCMLVFSSHVGQPRPK